MKTIGELEYDHERHAKIKRGVQWALIGVLAVYVAYLHYITWAAMNPCGFC